MPSDDPTLVLRPQGWQGKTHVLDGREVTIGRHPSNTVRLTDDKASRHHCAIRPDDAGRYVVVDLQSRNGTRVNGSRERRAALSDGDELQLGKLRLRVIVKE